MGLCLLPFCWLCGLSKDLLVPKKGGQKYSFYFVSHYIFGIPRKSKCHNTDHEIPQNFFCDKVINIVNWMV